MIRSRVILLHPTLGGALESTAPRDRTSGDTSHTVVWCLEQLPGLYAKFCQTRESRYGDEIRRLEQGILGELANSPLPGGPDGGGSRS